MTLLICNNYIQHFNMTKYLPSPFTIFPKSLLEHVNSIFWNYNNTKFSFPEISHRSQHFGSLNFQSQELIKAYFQVPENYHVIYLPNQAAYSAIPFNLIRFVNNSSIYLVNDAQSEFAYKEALKLNEKTVKINDLSKRKQVAGSLSEKPYYYYTFYSKVSLESGKVQEEPEPLQGQILVCNLNYCSHFQKIDVKKHGVIFFDAGRGFGLTGMTVVIVRKDLIGFQLDTCPDMMCFEKSITTKSIINTPYTLVPLLFAEYVTYCQKENKSLENVSAHLKTIKQNYVHAIAKKTTVVETSSNGIVIFKVPQTLPEQKWIEHGWKKGEFVTIMLQQQNDGKEEQFVNSIYA